MAAQDADYGLLVPGAHRARGLAGDRQVLRCLVRAETAWVAAQAQLGLVPDSAAEAVADVLTDEVLDRSFDLADLAERSELGGNPVIPMLADLRAAVREIDPEAVDAVHRGLTSQDVLDTALMLVLREALQHLDDSLSQARSALAGLAQRHRHALCAARTLTQHALPTTFGLRCAQWLEGLADAHERLDRLSTPVAIGGAAGTLAGSQALFEQQEDLQRGSACSAQLSEQVLQLHAAWARQLGLEEAPHVWHTARQPVLDAGAALGSVCAAIGRIADDVLLLSRPELGELREPTGPGRGVSSAMPQKQNPVLSVQLKRTALSAPQLLASLFTAASSSVDERPDGAWHVEWPALQQLLRLSLTACSQLAELAQGLRVDVERMEENLRASGPALLSERIVTALKPAVQEADGATGAQRIQAVLARAGADVEAAVDGLAEITGEGPDAQGHALDRQRLQQLCDPRGYLGAADLLIDRAFARQDEREALPGGGARTGEDS